MSETLQFLTQYGAAVLFVIVFVEQIGLPISAVPMLIAAGVLVRAGQMDPWVAAGSAVMAALLADWIWYEIGRKRGRRILNILSRISPEPNAYVRRTEEFFTKHGTWSIVLAKFIPGLGTMAVPFAGMAGMSLPLFLVYDGLGGVVWAGSSVGLGYAFSDEIDHALIYTDEVTWVFSVALMVGLFSFSAYNWIGRSIQRFPAVDLSTRRVPVAGGKGVESAVCG